MPSLRRPGQSSQRRRPVINIQSGSSHELIHLDGLVDVVISRGGAGLIRTVMKTDASVPVIETGSGVCHAPLTGCKGRCGYGRFHCPQCQVNQPGTCNSMETLLIHEIADAFMPAMVKRKLIKKRLVAANDW